MGKARCRFAPSPTGHLHIGGARTALFNWLFARHEGGEFVLRIEDTDPERSKTEYTEAILAGLRWLGLDWDGEPVYQSQRMDLYRQAAERLLATGQAYYCSCTAEEIEEMRKKAMAEGKKPKYDGRCRGRIDHPPDRPQVIRFVCPQEGETAVDDLILGRVTFDNSELDDLILIRSDGAPTYNFCVVVDDHDLEISHVIRGNDHLNNTPRQVLLYHALGWDLPQFAHHPLILGQDKSKLSKRHGATSLIAYQDLGYLPEAMMNFLARIGWSHGDQEIFGKDELVRLFDLAQLGKSPGVWNPEKLLWLNGHYIREKSAHDLAALVRPFLAAKGYDAKDGEYLQGVIDLTRERVKTLNEFADNFGFFFEDRLTYDEKARKKWFTAEGGQVLAKLALKLAPVEPFTDKTLEAAFTELVAETGLGLGKIAQPARLALTGRTESPGIFEVIALLGKDRTLKRFKAAVEVCPAA